jgi:hypothetical protein
MYYPIQISGVTEIGVGLEIASNEFGTIYGGLHYNTPLNVLTPLTVLLLLPMGLVLYTARTPLIKGSSLVFSRTMSVLSSKVSTLSY